MKHRMLPLTAAMAGLAGSLVMVAAPAAAGPGDPKKKDLRETECRDVVAGTARYVRDRLVDAPLPDKDYPDDLQGDGGTATLALDLAAVSCPEVTYTLLVYGGDGSLLRSASLPGDGSRGLPGSPLVIEARVDGYADDCLMLQATTSVQGIVVDTAPDQIEDYRAVCDGIPPGLTYK